MLYPIKDVASEYILCQKCDFSDTRRSLFGSAEYNSSGNLIGTTLRLFYVLYTYVASAYMLLC